MAFKNLQESYLITKIDHINWFSMGIFNLPASKCQNKSKYLLPSPTANTWNWYR